MSPRIHVEKSLEGEAESVKKVMSLIGFYSWNIRQQCKIIGISRVLVVFYF